MTNYKALFLEQSYNDNYDMFEASLSGKVAVWDYVILTASNEAQAKAYNEQLDHRLKTGMLPAETKYAVIPDPFGKRCGSGGATLAALKYIAENEGNTDLSELRILCIHSGGDSKRVPQYSACGKLFSPVPRVLPNGKKSTLFDELLIAHSGVPSRISSGLLTCTGDILVLYNPLQIDFYGDGAAALSTKENIIKGTNHGVFIGDSEGNAKSFYQKRTVDELKALGAPDQNGNVDIDTGTLLFSGKFVNSLYSLIDTDSKFEEIVNDKVRLSLYLDFIYPLVEDSTLEQFYDEVADGEHTPELRQAREKVWNTLRCYRIKIMRFCPSLFLHFGTTKEFLTLMTEDISKYSYLGWSDHVNCNIHQSDYAIYNSYIDKLAKIEKNCYIEHSDVQSGVSVGEGCVISSVTLKDVTVPAGTVLHGLKLEGERYVCRMFGVDDNPKSKMWMGTELDEALWTKPLFKVCGSMEEAVKACLNKDMTGELLSLKDSFEKADVTAIISWQDKLDDKVIAETILQAIDNHTPVGEVINQLSDGISERVERYLLNEAERLDESIMEQFSKKMRIYYYASQFIDKEALLDKCFGTLRDAIMIAVLKNTKYNPDSKIAKNEVITRLPVRVNWGGTWSDTPPYCLENGGIVINAAVSLNGQLPIEVTLRKIQENKIILASTDIGSYKEFTDIAQLQSCDDPGDAFALHKASLIACGVIPYKENVSVDEICKNLGGGIYMNTRVINIPKGSGLGTSSILAGACVKGLFEFLGIDADYSEMYNRVLCIEQIMSTGGGWQDQVGGLIPGIKAVTSAPGLEPHIVGTPIAVSKETLAELSERFALIYTGQRRLARNLLRDVVGGYIGNTPEVLDAIEGVQKVAVLLRFELERGNVDKVAELLNEHWRCSKQMDSGCTNTCIDQILLSVDDLTDGHMICGAGGGGFLQVIMKKGVTVEMLESRLNDVFADSGVGVWRCEFV